MTQTLTPRAETTHDVLAAFNNVTKTFGGHTALNAVNLDVFAGSAVGLLGPNGAGKSTLISLLTGLRKPDAGVVQLFGENPRRPSARHALGVTPQATAVPQTLKVREAVSLVATHFTHPVPPDELLERFGLTDMAGKQCGALSGGQQRRLLVAIALAGRPRLLVLDEPTTGLDVEAREALWEQLRIYRRDGGTLLITSHYLAEIEALANRIVVIDKGSITADGTPAEIRSHIQVRRVSLRAAPADLATLSNVLSASTDDDGVTTLTTRDADALVRELVEHHIPFNDLEVQRVSLEEAFLALTASHSGQQPNQSLRESR